jgi:hypothetical protein
MEPSWLVHRFMVEPTLHPRERIQQMPGTLAPMNTDVILTEAERLLTAHSPDVFDTSIDGFPNCIEYVRRVEDEEAWRAGYPSLEAFYDTQAARHPDIRSYARVRRDIATISPVHDPGGLPSALLARLRGESDPD